MPVYPVAAARNRNFIVPSFLGAYDAIPSIVAAYSSRRMLSAYTGKPWRLRRDSDNDEMWSRFLGNGPHLDVAHTADFLNGANGTIVEWASQSGTWISDNEGTDGADATQTTAASQPLYVASGQNGRPVLRFDGDDDVLSTPSMTTQHILVVILPRQQNSYPGFIGAVGGAGVNVHGIITHSTTNQFYPHDTTQYRQNASAATTCTFGSFQVLQRIRVASASGIVHLARDTDGGTYANCDIAELIICNAALSDANRQLTEAAAANYWGITLS